MKLEDLKMRGVIFARVGEKTDYSKAYVSLVQQGKMKPGRKFLKALEKVNLNDVVWDYAKSKDSLNNS